MGSQRESAKRKGGGTNTACRLLTLHHPRQPNPMPPKGQHPKPTQTMPKSSCHTHPLEELRHLAGRHVSKRDALHHKDQQRKAQGGVQRVA